MSILESIDSPADLKRVPVDQLPLLAEEIREQIISVTSAVGGHLSSNLGVVEITLALHYLLDTPKDKIVWDTSNQAYAHKLLTGRREHFHTLRQYGGLSGFCKREESIYDTFNAGHAGTGVSAAIGMAAARDLAEQYHKVVCVVGDGAMTSGMTLEAMQHVGGLQKDLLVILNDNQMSISRNVGSLSAYLNRTFTGEFVTHIREEAKHLLKAIPRVGDQLTRLAHRAEELAKGLVLPGVLFEELGFRYVGPIDGHNFEHLLPTLENVLKLKRPALLHVITKKGKGYEPAVKDAVWFHACSPFIRETGQPAKPSTKPSYTAVAIKTLCRLAREDRRIVAITAAMCEGTGLTAFQKEFPDRFHDVGIAEQHALKEGGVHRHDRPRALRRQAGREGQRVLLGDAHVVKPARELLLEGGQPRPFAHGRRDGDNAPVFACQPAQRLDSHRRIGWFRAGFGGLARLPNERRTGMEPDCVLHSRLIPLALLGDHVK